MNGLEHIYEQRIKFVHINIHDQKNLAIMQQFGFNTSPEFYLLDAHGKIIHFWNETVTEAELRQAFDAALQEAPLKP